MSAVKRARTAPMEAGMEENWLVYVNGEMVTAQEATLSVFDRGFLYGDAVFEGLRCHDGRIFKLTEHTERLFRSAAAVGITVPMTRQAFNDAVKRAVRANGFANAHIRPQVSRGVAWKLGLDARNASNPNVVIIVRPIGKSMFETEQGLKLASVSVRKIPAASIDPRIKSCNYLVNILARAEAVASGADEAIMFDTQGRLSEGSGDNIFLVRDGRLFTPPVEDALEGITRETVLDLASRLGIDTCQKVLTVYDVYNAAEVFVTGSAAGIMPVAQVDRRAVPSGVPGPVTKRLIAAYEEEVAQLGEPIDVTG